MPTNAQGALFLDRDGVININHGYVHRSEDFDWIDGIFDLVKSANQNDLKVIVVTNQAGIGRGYYSEQDFSTLTSWMKKSFQDEGCKIDGVYFCPHHPDAGLGAYLKDCDFRKPKPGMMLKAIEEHNISPSLSIMVGDKKSDMQAAANANIARRILFSKDEKQKSDFQTELVHGLNEIQI